MEFPFIDGVRIPLFLHLLGFAMGLGGAIVTDLFFFRFIRDFRISRQEADLMRILSGIMWTGILLLTVSGVWLFAMNTERYLASDRFLAKMTIVAALLVNGTFLHIVIAPKLHKIAYHEKTHPKHDELKRLRRQAFVSGGISFASWFSAFVLAWLKWRDVPYIAYIAAYALFLTSAVTGSLLIDRQMERKSRVQ